MTAGRVPADRATGDSREDEEAAAVLAVVAALAGASAPAVRPAAPSSIWADPVHLLADRPEPSATGWWASGMPR